MTRVSFPSGTRGWEENELGIFILLVPSVPRSQGTVLTFRVRDGHLTLAESTDAHQCLHPLLFSIASFSLLHLQGSHSQFLPMAVSRVVRRLVLPLLYFPHQLTSCRECEEDLGSDILGRLWLYTEIAWIPEWPCGADPICWPHIRLWHEQKLNLFCIHFWHLGTICYNSRPIPGWLSSFAFHLLWIQWFVFNSQTSKLHLIFQTRTTPTPLTLLAAKFTWKHRCSKHT